MVNLPLKKLKDYFKRCDNVVMAFVFGSYARKDQTSESDFDVAVYFEIDEESERKEERIYEEEGKIWSEVKEIVKREVDLTCLNYAPASLISEIIKVGIPLIIKNERLYWQLYLKNSLEAEDFLSFVQGYFKIYKAAKSLTPEQKIRLLERIQFLESEFKEIEEFKELTVEEYKSNKKERRNIERWVENLLNAIIDISKIILASERRMMPKTYEDALYDFGVLAGLNREDAKKFARLSNLRNILAHEYLDILFGRIQNFIKEFPLFYQKIYSFLERY